LNPETGNAAIWRFITEFREEPNFFGNLAGKILK